ncbi:hypothetical protein BJX99DRAFT_250808 [Aspergillus californicus]
MTTTSLQRRQQAAPNPALNQPNTTPPPPNRPSSALDNTRTLRRTSRYSSRRPGSVDASGRPFHIEEIIPVLVQPASEDFTFYPAPSEARTGNEDEHSDSAPGENLQTANGSYWPRRSTRVSHNTASAILWALEEAIRKPFPFTSDWDEVNASMSDLGGPGVPGLVGNGRSQTGVSRATQGPIPVNTHTISGVRTPTDIMRQRRDREARRKAEQDAKDQEQEEAELRQLQKEQARRRAAQRPPTAGEPPRTTTNVPGQSPTSPWQADAQAQAPFTAATQPKQPTASAPFPSQQAPPSKATTQQAQAQASPAAGEPATAQPQPQPRRVGFPHAFERWETLSSHWEGLTSYWIRKLEQNNDALERDPLSQQMARQVTDLSAAGANLFHAVVELQRLRASSERKFQRWFFDTRADQERAKELTADLERQVRTERQTRTEAVTTLQKSESEKARVEEMLREMRRELQISKDEARRAWEELGRREQEERDRTTSLRNGEPTLVGGVQVVPMIAGLPRRDSARPPTREGPYTEGKNTADQLYGNTPVSPVPTDPFVEGQGPVHEPHVQGYSQEPQPASIAAPAQAQYAGHYYDPGTAYPQASAARDPSVGSSEPGEDYGYQQNPQGRQIGYPRPMSEESEEYEQASLEDTEGGFPASTLPPTSSPMFAGYDQSVDYSGSGWGVGSGWESLTPRHRHPTRLSDVLEEEEPRTTPSRASRASRASQASRSVQ